MLLAETRRLVKLTLIFVLNDWGLGGDSCSICNQLDNSLLLYLHSAEVHINAHKLMAVQGCTATTLLF